MLLAASVLVSSISLLAAVPTALAHPENCFEVTVTGDIAGYKCEGENLHIVIPEYVSGVKVKSIGNYAFRRKAIAGVTIPDSVTHIGDGAFIDNWIRQVVLPGNLISIGKRAFRGNQLAVVNIPDGVEHIGAYAFANNEIFHVSIPDSVKNLDNGAFYTNRLETIQIPKGIESLETLTFAFNFLKKIVIPENIQSIGDASFSNNQIEVIVIPESVRSIGRSAFIYNDNLKSVTIGESVSITTSSFDEGFFEAYSANYMKAGTYVLRGWTETRNQITWKSRVYFFKDSVNSLSEHLF